FIDQRGRAAGSRIGKPGEIAGSLCGGWNNRRLRLSLGIALALVVQKEKNFVLSERTAQGSPVLISIHKANGRGEEIPRVQGVVPEEIVNVAVEIVAAGFGHYRRGRAAGVSVFSRSIQSENPEFVDSVHGNPQRVSSVHAVHIG